MSDTNGQSPPLEHAEELGTHRHCYLSRGDLVEIKELKVSENSGE